MRRADYSVFKQFSSTNQRHRHFNWSRLNDERRPFTITSRPACIAASLA